MTGRAMQFDILTFRLRPCRCETSVLDHHGILVALLFHYDGCLTLVSLSG